MEGESIAASLKASLYVVAQRHFQTLDDLLFCAIFIVCAIAIFQVFNWILSVLIKLMLPLIICFVFLVLFSEHYSSTTLKTIGLLQSFYFTASSAFRTVMSFLPGLE